MLVMLDVDGVLNSGAWRRSGRPGEVAGAEGLDPAAVALLDPLVELGARFVLSSAWRLLVTVPQMQRMLESVGFSGMLVGHTPVPPKGSGLVLAKPRGQEILEWLCANDCTDEPLVILDDEGPDWMAPWQECLVQTDFESGLQPHHVARAIHLLRLGSGGADATEATAGDGHRTR